MPNRPSDTPGASVQTAIQAALTQDWKKAIRLNLLLIKTDPKDTDTINRLGFAYLKTGQFTAARRTFDTVLKVDPYNQIALKNAKKLGTMKRKDIEHGQTQRISPLQFLEEPGKTKIVSLVNPAPTRVLAALSSGQDVVLKPRNHCVEIRSNANLYLGALPDDLSFKLIKLISHGNRYHVVIKSIGKNALTVLVRETARGKRFAGQPSFTASTTYIPSLRIDPKDAPDVTATGEEDGDGKTEEDAPAP